MTIRESITGKSLQERATIKAKEVTKIDAKGSFDEKGFTIEILGLKEIDAGGVEVMLKAWNGAKKIGFGSDGTVETERVRIFNPPILVDDPNGSIEFTSTDEKTGVITVRKLREDPSQALKEVLAHVVRVIGKDGKNVQQGKVGNTTSTFYPAVDGRTQRIGSQETWATIVAGAGTDFADSDTNRNVAGPGADTNTDRYGSLLRGWFKFLTSAIPDTDDISAATLSLYVVNAISDLGGAISFVGGTVASTTNLAATDHVNRLSTKFATDWTLSGMTEGAMKDAALNASGIAAISKTGYTTIVAILDKELSGAPTWTLSGDASSLLEVRLSEFSGTSSDPVLVVVHAAAPTATETTLNRTPVRGVGRGIMRP